MQLPTKQEALERIHALAENDDVEVHRNAWRDASSLGYLKADICDMLYDLVEDECEKIEEGHHAPNPVATFHKWFLSDKHAAEGLERNELFVEVEIRSADLYVRACKLDGSPR